MRKIIIIVLLAAILGVFALTNPSMSDYQNFIRQEVIKESQKGVTASGEITFGQMMGPFLGGIAGGFIASQTIRSDYAFFSIYDMSFGKQRFRVVGIFKRFMVLEAPRLGTPSPG